MDKNHVILELFQHQVTCCCPGEKHQHMIEFFPGDVWTITDERKYVDCLGWHFLIVVNEEYQFFMQVGEIEELYSEGTICSILDLDLRINHLGYKINEALDAHDRESFLSFADELSNIQEIKNKMNTEDVHAF
ncbi:hypothetical protein ABE28_008580 [Peribacillus muralis]|uniref:IDEAL domain-containing protein n=1 Tax=Peribacillus muralis TaxID=264697 RepID=A0A1B3XMG6_9BACI|nr:hypothetical protein [Peribacillus muralis]AOH54407.1 hypothetical protein ABE28_008580 [Peribacillus muralis]